MPVVGELPRQEGQWSEEGPSVVQRPLPLGEPWQGIRDELFEVAGSGENG